MEDPIERAYHLEVSSPGIDRPLVRRSDFARWRGHVAKIDTSVMVGGRKRFRGTITDAGDEGVTLFRDQPSIGDDNENLIPYAAIADARLVLTDELIRASLKADKAARLARGGPDTFDDEPFEDNAGGVPDSDTD